MVCFIEIWWPVLTVYCNSDCVFHILLFQSSGGQEGVSLSVILIFPLFPELKACFCTLCFCNISGYFPQGNFQNPTCSPWSNTFDLSSASWPSRVLKDNVGQQQIVHYYGWLMSTCQWHSLMFCNLTMSN